MSSSAPTIKDVAPATKEAESKPAGAAPVKKELTEKKCRICGETKDKAKFSPSEWRYRGAARCKSCRKFGNLLRTYKLTRKAFFELLETQKNTCAICPTTLTQWTAHVDHWHTGTNKVRGLLCVKCNTGLGKLGDSPDSLLRAVLYLCKAADELSPTTHAAITILLTSTSEQLAKVPQKK